MRVSPSAVSQPHVVPRGFSMLLTEPLAKVAGYRDLESAVSRHTPRRALAVGHAHVRMPTYCSHCPPL
jgi:hypothetical protein